MNCQNVWLSKHASWITDELRMKSFRKQLAGFRIFCSFSDIILQKMSKVRKRENIFVNNYCSSKTESNLNCKNSLPTDCFQFPVSFFFRKFVKNRVPLEMPIMNLMVNKRLLLLILWVLWMDIFLQKISRQVEWTYTTREFLRKKYFKNFRFHTLRIKSNTIIKSHHFMYLKYYP